MRRSPSRSFLFAAPVLLPGLALLSGCGLSGDGSAISNAAYPNISGNWSIVASAGSNTVPVSAFVGSLQSTGPSVTGVLHSQDVRSVTSPCITLGTDLPFSGTVDILGNVSLTGNISGGTATIKGLVLPASLHSAAAFTLAISGGTCAEAQLPAAGVEIAPVTGSYSGTLTGLSSSSTSTVIASLTQSATPDTHGRFPLSGIVQVSGAACTFNFTVTNQVVTGPSVTLDPTASLPPQLSLITGVVPPDASTLAATLSSTVLTSPCLGVQGTLTRH